MVVALTALVALAACGGDDGSGDGTASGETTEPTGSVTNDDGSVDECALLTDAEAEELMLVEPYAPGAPDNDACSWGTDPLDRANLNAYVVLEVQPLEDVLDGRYPDYRTYLDESTNVGIEDLPGLGDEAFIVSPPLSGIGIDVVDGDQTVSLSIQPAEPYDADSPEFERAVEIMEEILNRL